MTEKEKIALAISDLTARGVSKGVAAPPLFLLAWKLGIDLPPPLFISFTGLALVNGPFFGALWGLFMWLALWSREGWSATAAIAASLAAGSLFGVMMAFYFRRRARKLSLPLWNDYGKQG
jgi:hypothetical protein